MICSIVEPLPPSRYALIMASVLDVILIWIFAFNFVHKIQNTIHLIFCGFFLTLRRTSSPHRRNCAAANISCNLTDIAAHALCHLDHTKHFFIAAINIKTKSSKLFFDLNSLYIKVWISPTLPFHMGLNAAAQIVDNEIPTIAVGESKSHERVCGRCVLVCEDIGIAGV